MPPAARLSVFLTVSAAFAGAAILLGVGVPAPSAPVDLRAPRVSSLAPRPRAGGEVGALTGSARRFLVAFTRYEVGDRSTAVLATLRSTATPSFARALLDEPPRAAAVTPRVARLAQLSVAVVSRRPASALVDAVAHRPSGPEQLAFLFLRRDGAWLAAAPGE